MYECDSRLAHKRQSAPAGWPPDGLVPGPREVDTATSGEVELVWPLQQRELRRSAAWVHVSAAPSVHKDSDEVAPQDRTVMS